MTDPNPRKFAGTMIGGSGFGQGEQPAQAPNPQAPAQPAASPAAAPTPAAPTPPGRGLASTVFIPQQVASPPAGSSPAPDGPPEAAAGKPAPARMASTMFMGDPGVEDFKRQMAAARQARSSNPPPHEAPLGPTGQGQAGPGAPSPSAQHYLGGGGGAAPPPAGLPPTQAVAAYPEGEGWGAAPTHAMPSYPPPGAEPTGLGGPMGSSPPGPVQGAPAAPVNAFGPAGYANDMRGAAGLPGPQASAAQAGVAGPAQKRSRAWIPLLLGVGLLGVLLVAGGGLFLWRGSLGASESSELPANAATLPIPEPLAPQGAPAGERPTGAPAALGEQGAAAPEATAAAQAEGAEGAEGAGEGEPTVPTVLLSCSPDCASMKSIVCDDDELELVEGGLVLAPGQHRCVFSAAGYASSAVRLEVEAGQAAREHRIVLSKWTPRPKEACGTFINPCQ